MIKIFAIVLITNLCAQEQQQALDAYMRSNYFSLIDQLHVRYLADEAKVKIVAWAPDGQRFATAGTDILIRVFNIAQTGCEKFFKTHKKVSCLAFSHNAKQLAAAHEKTIKVFNLEQEQLIELQGHLQDICFLQFDKRNHLLSYDGKYVWTHDLHSGSSTMTFGACPGASSAPLVSPLGDYRLVKSKTVLEGHQYGTVLLYPLSVVALRHIFKLNGITSIEDIEKYLENEKWLAQQKACTLL